MNHFYKPSLELAMKTCHVDFMNVEVRFIFGKAKNHRYTSNTDIRSNRLKLRE